MVHDFIPATSPRQISPHIYFRPIRSWHSATYAGEGLTVVKTDKSGYLLNNGLCYAPKTVTHRIYWHDETNKFISAFLSYPDAMGCVDEYFWEIYPGDNEDVDRFFSEAEMEAKIISILNSNGGFDP